MNTAGILRKGYQETFVTYNSDGKPKGSSNINYRINDNELKAVNYIGECWSEFHKKRRTDAAVERMTQ